jgi:ABC-type transport system involved in multi-copper enzyme maturation permease subunit
MAWRWGPGPVFALELRGAARRWQTYATRAGFVAALFVAFAFVWWTNVAGRDYVSVPEMARAGEQFFYALVGTQLVLLLLAAPAATASAVSQDPGRGGLLALLVTDLSDAEIVLGKLFARLLPVLGLLACGLPVPGIAMLMGGISAEALLGAYLVTAGITVLACAVALTLSVWATRPHEALLGTYLTLAVLLILYPAREAVAPWLGLQATPTWLAKTNPIWLAFAPYLYPGATDLSDALTFLEISLALSAGLTAVAVARVRAVTLAAAGRPDRPRRVAKLPRSWLPDPGLPGPDLDSNPVLWREWHRPVTPLRARRVWWLYALLATGFSLLAIVKQNVMFASWVNGAQVSAGLLLFSVTAVLSLAEERTCGSLDVLLSTPLSASEILWGKWWGTYRFVPILTALPVVVQIGVIGSHGSSRRIVVQIFGPVLMAALILAYGAAVTSLGLAIATRVSRLWLAVVWSAGSFVLMTGGWLLLSFLCCGFPYGPLLSVGSPFVGPVFLTGGSESIEDAAVLAWIAAYLVATAVFMDDTYQAFDDCFGRVRQRESSQSVA